LQEAGTKAVPQWIGVIVEFDFVKSILMEVDFFFEFDQSLVEFLSFLVELREGVDVILVIAGDFDICSVYFLHI
jgi:hypothetical protein